LNKHYSKLSANSFRQFWRSSWRQPVTQRVAQMGPGVILSHISSINPAEHSRISPLRGSKETESISTAWGSFFHETDCTD